MWRQAENSVSTYSELYSVTYEDVSWSASLCGGCCLCQGCIKSSTAEGRWNSQTVRGSAGSVSLETAEGWWESGNAEHHIPMCSEIHSFLHFMGKNSKIMSRNITCYGLDSGFLEKLFHIREGKDIMRAKETKGESLTKKTEKNYWIKLINVLF